MINAVALSCPLASKNSKKTYGRIQSHRKNGCIQLGLWVLALKHSDTRYCFIKTVSFAGKQNALLEELEDQ